MEKHYLDYEGLENFRQVQKITDQVLVDNNSILLLDGDQFDVYLMPEKCVVYVLSNGTSVYKRGCFYEVTHTEISNPSGNPRSKWYYEKVSASYFTVMGLGPKAAAKLADTLYTRSQDTSVKPGKTYYDRNRSYLFNKLLYAQIVDTMPTAASAWAGYSVYYKGEDTADYKKGHTYYCSGSGSTYTWTDISLESSGDSIQVTALPTASADELGNIYQYVGVTDTDYTNGYFYKCVSDGEATPTYSWKQVDVGDYIEKVTTMPTASSDELGKEYQYMGTDDSTNGLIHAHFYECVSDGESTPTYSWHDLGYKKVFQGTLDGWNALTEEEQAKYDFIASPDENGYTDSYSTTETKTNKVWIDGKPIYRKCFTSLATVTTGWTNLVEKGDVETLTFADYAVSTSGVRNGFMQVRFSGDYLQVSTGASGGLTGIVGIYLEYTKTT